MTALTVKLHGQSLVLTAYAFNGEAADLYNDPACGESDAITIPATLTSDESYYLPDVTGYGEITFEQLDGTSLAPIRFEVMIGNVATVEPRPSSDQLAADVSVYVALPAEPTSVTGTRGTGDSDILASLLTALDGLGLISDDTSSGA